MHAPASLAPARSAAGGRTSRRGVDPVASVGDFGLRQEPRGRGAPQTFSAPGAGAPVTRATRRTLARARATHPPERRRRAVFQHPRTTARPEARVVDTLVDHDNDRRTRLSGWRTPPQTRPGGPGRHRPSPDRRGPFRHGQQTPAWVVLHLGAWRSPIRRGRRGWSTHRRIRVAPAGSMDVGPSAGHGVGTRDGFAAATAAWSPSRVGPTRTLRSGFDLGRRPS